MLLNQSTEFLIHPHLGLLELKIQQVYKIFYSLSSTKRHYEFIFYETYQNRKFTHKGK